MLKKIKNIAIFLFSGLLFIEFSLIFLGNYSEEFQKIRREYLLSTADNLEQKVIDLTTWKKIKSDKEILIDGDYFDIHSYQVVNEKVYLTIKKDTFENYIKHFFKINKKPNKPSEKKKNVKVNVYLMNDKSFISKNVFINFYPIKNLFCFQLTKTKGFSKYLFKPPIFQYT